VRPVEMEVRGFTCFRAPTRVDFRGLDLFAITGPTGAGKTSLLEAMIYALYGRSPKVSNEVRHLLSQGAEKSLVDLTFSSSKTTYRVVRTINKAGKTEARIEHWVDDKYVSLAAGSRDVTATTERLLGLDYEAFVRTVVLPQGRFDEFLKGQASDRQRILTSLLDLSIYEKMRQRASEVLSSLDVRLQDVESRIAELGYATETTLDEEKQKLIKQEAEAAKIIEERQRVETEVKSAKDTLESAKQLHKARQALDRLRGESGRIDEKKLLLSRARTAAPLLPLWRHLLQLTEREREERAEVHAKEEAAQHAQEEATQAERQQQNAKQEAQQIPSLEAEIVKLREGVTIAQLHRAQTEELNRATNRAKDASKAETNAQKEMSQKKAEGEQLRKELLQLQAEKDTFKPAPEAIATLKDAQRTENEYAKTRASYSKSKESVKASDEAFQAAKKKQVEVDEALRLISQEVKDREIILEEKKVAFDNARITNLAEAMRKHLRPGDQCPVCLGQVKDLPPLKPTALDIAEAAVKEAQAALKSASQQRETLLRDLTEASANLAAQAEGLRANQKKLEEIAEQGAERAKELERLLTHLREELQKQLSDKDDEGEREFKALVHELKVPEDKKRLKGTLEELKKQLEARANHASKLEQDILNTETNIDRVAEEIAKLSGRVERAAEERNLARTDEARLIRAVENLKKQLLSIGDNPEDRLEEITKRKEKLAQDAALAAQQATLARARANDAKGSLAEASKTAKIAEEERTKAERELTPKMLAAGFSDAQSLSAAALPEEEGSRYAVQIAEHEKELAHFSKEEKELLEILGDRRTDPTQIESMTLLAAELQKQERKIVADVGALEQRVKNLNDALVRKRLLIDDERKLRKQHERTGRLALDLRGDRFQTFVLDEAFRFLAEDGSKQIHRLSSERYTFSVKEREFYVLDHWNAAEARTVKTLSGGETFLASMALSVALAERIHDLCTAASGDRMLESLFLDEGFGTLDPESLDVVIGALEELRTSGRMVGVISHVPELTARLPSRVVVEKGPAGSTVTQEGGG
jgi:exonuclease SbcC